MANRIPSDMIEDRSTGEKISATLSSHATQLAHIAYNAENEKRLAPETNDNGRVQRVLDSSHEVVLFPKTYNISTAMIVPKNKKIIGNGTIESSSTTSDVFLIQGSNTDGDEGQNIYISDLTIIGGRFGVQVYGEGNTYLPHDIVIERVKTKSTTAGGMFLNSCTDVDVVGCMNWGGFRHVGTFAPIANPRITKNIKIQDCFSWDTTQYGYQTYYGEQIEINNCFANGSASTGGDKTCVTIDRTNNVTITGGTYILAPNDQIFITGSENVTVNSPVCIGGARGIQAFYNNESAEDATIKESKGVTVTGAVCVDNTIGIVYNGVILGSITANVCRGQTTNSIYLQNQTRASDSVAMTLQNITVQGNICDKNIHKASSDTPITFIGNDAPDITGLSTTDIVLGKNTMRFGNKQLENFGLLKRTGMSNQLMFAEWGLSDAYHKGMNWHYEYGKWVLKDSAGTVIFRLGIGEGGGDVGDIELVKSGKGIIFKSPDGLTRKRLSIDNTGAEVWTTV